MATKYERYGTPVQPVDPDAEYLSVQETAWVFRCSVPTIRRRCKQLELGSTIGARLMLDRDERRAIFNYTRRGPATRVPAQRRRKPRTATKATQTPAAA
jgi:hypothetical protein